MPALSRRRSVRAALIASPILGAAAGSLPLLEVPGYELAQAAALLAALVLSPWLGIAAARVERPPPLPGPLPPHSGGRGGIEEREATPPPQPPSPASLERGERRTRSILTAWASSSALSAALLAGIFAGSALRAAFGPCHPFQAAAFFPALALPSALLGCAIASAAGFVTRGRRGAAAALYAAVVLVLVAARLLQAYRGPAAFFLDPLLGYIPGPLYDEAVPFDGRLLLARVEALGWAATVAGLAGALLRPRPPPPPLQRSWGGGWGVGLAAGILLVAGGFAGRAALRGGLDPRAAIARRLGAVRVGPLCTVFLASEKPAAAADELLAECEFHAADIAAILGVPNPPRVTVYVYRTADEKRELVGASRTDFTRPWLAEIHLLDQPLPHPVLRHEIVHAVASALAPGPLHVPARGRILPSLVLVEGLAVALESPRSGFTVHQWSRAALDLGLLPDLGRILGPGFWSQAPARAYTAAGSFLAYLLERYGPAPVRSAYRDGDLARAYGRPLPDLIREWQAALRAVPPREDLATAAALWFGRGSLFERRCAREAAGLLRDAGAAAALGRTAEACRLYARAAEVDEAPDVLLLQGEVLAEAGELAAAESALRAAAARTPAEDRARTAQLHDAEGDLAWRRGDVASALRSWAEAASFPFQRATARLLAVKSLAAADPALGPAVRAYLLNPADPWGLVQVARSGHPLAAYLVGRSLLQRGERNLAAPELARAAAAGLPPLVDLEARLSLAEASCDPAYRPLLAPLAGAGQADLERLGEARRRCAISSETSRSPQPGSSLRSGEATRSP